MENVGAASASSSSASASIDASASSSTAGVSSSQSQARRRVVAPPLNSVNLETSTSFSVSEAASTSTLPTATTSSSSSSTTLHQQLASVSPPITPKVTLNSPSKTSKEGSPPTTACSYTAPHPTWPPPQDTPRRTPFLVFAIPTVARNPPQPYLELTLNALSKQLPKKGDAGLNGHDP